MTLEQAIYLCKIEEVLKELSQEEKKKFFKSQAKKFNTPIPDKEIDEFWNEHRCRVI